MKLFSGLRGSLSSPLSKFNMKLLTSIMICFYLYREKKKKKKEQPSLGVFLKPVPLQCPEGRWETSPWDHCAQLLLRREHANRNGFFTLCQSCSNSALSLLTWSQRRNKSGQAQWMAGNGKPVLLSAGRQDGPTPHLVNSPKAARSVLHHGWLWQALPGLRMQEVLGHCDL